MNSRPALCAICGVGALLLLAPLAPAQDVGADLANRAQAYAEAQAEYNLAASQHQRAQAQVIRERQAAIKQVQASDRYQGVVNAVDSARDGYYRSKQEVKQQLAATSKEYQQAMKDAQAVDAQIEQARKTPGTTPQQFTDLYNKKATYTSILKRLEDQALEQTGGTAMKKQWSEASKNLEAVQQQAVVAAESAPGVEKAKADAAAADARASQASVKLSGASAGYGEAKDAQNRAAEAMKNYSPAMFMTDYDYYGYRRW